VAGDAKLQAEGKADQAEGKWQNAVGVADEPDMGVQLTALKRMERSYQQSRFVQETAGRSSYPPAPLLISKLVPMAAKPPVCAPLSSRSARDSPGRGSPADQRWRDCGAMGARRHSGEEVHQVCRGLGKALSRPQLDADQAGQYRTLVIFFETLGLLNIINRIL
jgi:hypothetical protein